MFCDVTNLFGQICIVRDIGSRITGPPSAPKAWIPAGDLISELAKPSLAD